MRTVSREDLTGVLPQPALFPRYLFDPRWKDPEVAARVAVRAYLHHAKRAVSRARPLIEPEVLAAHDVSMARVRVELPLSFEHTVFERRFVGSAHNELYQRLAFGHPSRPTVHFYAKYVTLGIDHHGLFFLNAVIGREGGLHGHRGLLFATIHSTEGPIGGVKWTSSLDLPYDQNIELIGRDDRLRQMFDALTHIELRFGGECVSAPIRRRAKEKPGRVLQ